MSNVSKTFSRLSGNRDYYDAVGVTVEATAYHWGKESTIAGTVDRWSETANGLTVHLGDVEYSDNIEGRPTDFALTRHGTGGEVHATWTDWEDEGDPQVRKATVLFLSLNVD